ncbi:MULTISPECIES: ribonuclease P protein component [Roseobacteraceae]|uniref:Ribonuclease P protein component n=1 Tax=Pseudosulfitobacter pseudonitzschiae TaxID=1402135 RepID=A0A221K2Z9_9RHOB|nr:MULTISPECIES: ribonuclease P protein component [Roseobacteraceae]ASM73355.1 ribonuclease P protein component [Pseudosulfitobacter pseudonitzschiae]
MTPPEAPADSVRAGSDQPRAGLSRLAALKSDQVLKNRADFLRAARGPRVVTPGFVLQIRARGDDAPLRVGFTCSKKVGNAVARNRAKRRLREIARLELPAHGAAGTDYVLIGRHQVTATRDFEQMRRDLRAALAPK